MVSGISSFPGPETKTPAGLGRVRRAAERGRRCFCGSHDSVWTAWRAFAAYAAAAWGWSPAAMAAFNSATSSASFAPRLSLTVPALNT
jgi:hypothetical protein